MTPETRTAYQKYIADTDARIAAQNNAETGFLWMDAEAGRQQAVRRGEIVTQKVRSVPLREGMIQDWIGGAFIPNTTMAAVMTVDQSYADYEKFYGPDISQVKLVSQAGNHFVVAYRITKTKVLTAVLDTVQAIDYRALGPGRVAIQSRSQSVREVENAGKPNETDLPEGQGSGFLWGMNSYWRLQERDGGVYMECEAITLSRGVPTGLGLMVNPILQSFAEESLKKTIEATRQAVQRAQMTR